VSRPLQLFPAFSGKSVLVVDRFGAAPVGLCPGNGTWRRSVPVNRAMAGAATAAPIRRRRRHHVEPGYP